MSGIARPLEYILEVGLHRRLPGDTASFTPERVRRILVVRRDNIGDVQCATPALQTLPRVQEKLPDVQAVLGGDGPFRSVIQEAIKRHRHR